MAFVNFMAVTLFSLMASATTETTYNYDSLGKLYDSGTQANFSEIKGWRSGRCFKKSNPTTPLAFMLVALEMKEEGKQAVKHMSIVSHFGDNLKADRYDKLTDKDREAFDTFMQSSEFLTSEVSGKDNTISSHLGLGVQAVKKSGDIYVGILRHSQEKDYDYNCFFFKEIQ